MSDERLRDELRKTLDWLGSFSMPPTATIAEKDERMRAIEAALAPPDPRVRTGDRSDWIEPLERNDDPELSTAIRVTPTYVLMTPEAHHLERSVWEKWRQRAQTAEAALAEAQQIIETLKATIAASYELDECGPR